MSTSAAGILLVVGSALFLAGAAIAVPRVFTEPDRSVRLRMIEARLGAWRAGQPLYAAGPVVAAVGAGLLAAGSDADAWFIASGSLLGVGALAWARSVYMRWSHYREFALGTLPGWPFATYALFTIAGLAALGIGLHVSDFGGWLVGLTLVADATFLAAYLVTKDLPPFVFYLILGTVGLVAL